MQQRYRSNPPNREIELPSLGYNSLTRSNQSNLEADMVKQLQRSLSKQSYQLSHHSKSKPRKNGSKGSLLNKKEGDGLWQGDNIYKTGYSLDGRNGRRQRNEPAGNWRNRNEYTHTTEQDSYRAMDYRSQDQKDQNQGQVKQAMQAYTSVEAPKVQPDSNYLQNVHTKKFQFKILSYLLQVVIGYAITIGLMYLIPASNGFPYFLILVSTGLMFSLQPFHKTSLLLLLTSASIIIANYFLSLQILTYPLLLIIYFSFLLFIEQNKQKIIFIPILVLILTWGFIVIPALYKQFVLKGNTKGFYYVFPIFMYLGRVWMYAGYQWVKYSEYLYLQLPFFLAGLQIGVMLSLSVSDIQFWYLIVCYTLLIVNDRTQFTIDILSSVFKAFSNIDKKKKKGKSKLHNNIQNGSHELLKSTSSESSSSPAITHISILPSHSSGHACIHSFHLICILYFFLLAQVYSPPYSSSTSLSGYVTDLMYKPLIIWAFTIIYEGMCLILQRKRRDKLLIGYVDNGIKETVMRGLILGVGLWSFYLGLGIGNLAIKSA